MKRHAPIGADILAVIGLLRRGADRAASPRELGRSSGYPDGLTGGHPHRFADHRGGGLFDALTSDRPYRPAHGGSRRLPIERSEEAGLCDPRVVDAFVAMHGEEHGRDCRTACAREHCAGLRPRPVERADDERRTRTSRAFFNLGRALDGAVSASRARSNPVEPPANASAGVDIRPLRLCRGERHDRGCTRGRRVCQRGRGDTHAAPAID
jgi:hypothetical protein